MNDGMTITRDDTNKSLVIYTVYCKQGLDEVTSRYVLANLVGLGEQDPLKPSWFVTDVYRYYAHNGVDTKQLQFEVEYIDKSVLLARFEKEKNNRSIEDFIYHLQNGTSEPVIEDNIYIESIKTFVTYNNHREPCFRTDWYCNNAKGFTYRTIENGAANMPGYKKYEWKTYNQRFMCGNEQYDGDLASTNEIDQLLVDIKLLSEYELVPVKEEQPKELRMVLSLI